MSLDDLNRAINKSMGLTNFFTEANSINNALDRSMNFSKFMGTQNLWSNNVNRQMLNLNLGSLDWIRNNSSVKTFGLPNNLKNLTKSLGPGIAHILFQDDSQLAISNMITKRISSVIGNGSLGRILDSQQSILNNLTKLRAAVSMSNYLNQYRNTLNTLGSWSIIMAIQGMTSTLNHENYYDFEEATDELSNITDTVIEQQHVTIADLTAIYDLLNAINTKTESINKSEFNTLSFWLCVIGLFFSVYPLIQQKVDASDPAQATATQQQVIDLRDKLIATYHNNVNLYSTIRTTNRESRLLLKPQFKSQVLIVIPPNERLAVVNSRGKWVLITCLDKDSLPVTGWILKKYLNKPKVK